MKRHCPFLWIVGFFILGILCQTHYPFWGEKIAPLAAVVLGAAFVFRQKKGVFACLILVNFFWLGWLYTESRWLFGQDDIYFQKTGVDFSCVTLRGIIDSQPRDNPSGHAKRLTFVLNLKELKTQDNAARISGKVLVNLFQEVSLHYGDDILLTGKLHRPFEFSREDTFSYRDYLKRQGIIYVLSVKKNSTLQLIRPGQGNGLLSKLICWRLQADQKIFQQLNPVEASLTQAMILGERLNIPASLKDVFAKTGTTHILAISGLNVGIVVMVLFLLLRMIPGPPQMIYGLTVVFIVLYVLLTGASPSVVRAGIMSIVFLTSFVIERETQSVNSLGFAAFLILLLDPQNIFDIGFQLSFLSVFSILVFYPLFMIRIKPFLKRHPHKVLEFVIESFAVSLSASLGVAGLIAYYFKIVTPVSLLANLIVVPLSTLATILGIGMLLCGSLIPFFAVCITFVLNLMVWFMTLCQKLPWAYHYFQDVNSWGVASYYCVVCALWAWLTEQGFARRQLTKIGNYDKLSPQ